MFIKGRHFPELRDIFPPKLKDTIFPLTKSGEREGKGVSIVKRLSFQHIKCK